MIASWPALILLVVAQTSDELPQRLPALPPEYASGYATAATFLSPDLPQPTPLAPGQQPPWQAGSSNALILPPPPEASHATALAPTYELPATVIDETEWDEPPLPGTRISFATLGAGTGFSTTSFDINRTWLLGYSDGPPLSITPGWGMHFWGDGVGLGLPARVYDLYVDMQWTPWTGDQWSLSVGLTPGLYSDFSHAGGDMFQLTGWIIGNWQFEPEWQLVLGAAYVRQLQTTLVPVGGLIWTPDENHRLELVFPKPKYAVRYRENESGSLWWFVAGQLGGGAWSVADGPNNDALVAYSDLRLAVGVEKFCVNGHEWSVELSYAFDRQLSIDHWHAANLGSAFCVSASLGF
jgi:hypothetical protein